METDRQSSEPKLASLSSLRKSNNDIQIIQFYPAWSLHALLRFCNFSYECNNSDINTSLGMALPHLQDGQYAYSLRMALEHIESRRQQLDEPSLSSMKSVAMLTNSSSQLSDSPESSEKVEQPEIIPPPTTSSNPNSNKYKANIETSPDMVMASHIDHITNIYNQYSKLSKNNIKDFYKSTTWIANLFIMGWVQLSYSLFRNDNDYILSLTEKYEPYPDSTADELFNRLKEAYSELAARLEKYSGSLFKISKKKDKDIPKANTVNARRISDALLFGHLAIGLCNEEISVIIEKHPALMSFFTTICKEYFSDPIITNKSKVLSWHIATNQILHNKFLTLNKCKKVKEAISPSIESIKLISLNRNYDKNDSTEFTTIHTHYYEFYDRSKKIISLIKNGKIFERNDTDDNTIPSSISSDMNIHITVPGTFYLIVTSLCFVGYAGIVTLNSSK